MPLEDLDWKAGQDNMAGIIGPAWVVPIDDVDAPLPALAAAGGVTISGNIVLKSLKKFFKLYTTDQAAKADYNSVGVRDGMSKESIIELKYPGDDEAVAKFEREIQNTPLVIIYTDGNGKLRVMGLINLDKSVTDLKLRGAYLTGGNGTTGTANADDHGTTFQFTMNASHRPLFYTGTIDVDSAT